ncbi:MAG: maleylacetoacetate isomerase [Parvularculaceae bacterium]|nr:maleylacetoacetate isomerase [Parvularculaceae bacterium]
MKLHTYFRSSASFRVRIALQLKGVDWTPSYVNLRQNEHLGDFAAINPARAVPVLEDGSLKLTQSLAIMEYLDDKIADPQLLPSDPADRAIVRSMSQLIACEIHPLNNLRVLKYLRADLGQSDDGVSTWYAHWVNQGFEALEKMAVEHGSAGRCFGSTVTMADVCLVPQIWNARRFEVDLSAFPRLLEIDASLNELKAFASAAPQNQPDAV